MVLWMRSKFYQFGLRKGLINKVYMCESIKPSQYDRVILGKVLG